MSEIEMKKTPISFAVATKRIKYLGINLIQELQSIIKRDWKRHNEMERYSMFMDWKNQHSSNVHITQSNIQI